MNSVFIKYLDHYICSKPEKKKLFPLIIMYYETECLWVVYVCFFNVFTSKKLDYLRALHVKAGFPNLVAHIIKFEQKLFSFIWNSSTQNKPFHRFVISEDHKKCFLKAFVLVSYILVKESLQSLIGHWLHLKFVRMLNKTSMFCTVTSLVRRV